MRGFLEQLKIFVWYLTTGPFRQIAEFFTKTKRELGTLSKDRTWAMIAIVIGVIAISVNKPIVTMFTLCLALILLLKAEWTSKQFIHEWKEHKRKKEDKEMESEKK